MYPILALLAVSAWLGCRSASRDEPVSAAPLLGACLLVAVALTFARFY